MPVYVCCSVTSSTDHCDEFSSFQLEWFPMNSYIAIHTVLICKDTRWMCISHSPSERVETNTMLLGGWQKHLSYFLTQHVLHSPHLGDCSVNPPPPRIRGTRPVMLHTHEIRSYTTRHPIRPYGRIILAVVTNWITLA